MDPKKILLIGGPHDIGIISALHQIEFQPLEVIQVSEFPHSFPEKEKPPIGLNNFFERDYLKEFEFIPRVNDHVFYPEKPNYLNGRKLPRSYKSKRK